MINVRARRGFTLLEMLIVMAIAMIMMGALVSGYQKIKHGQDLSLGASAVQGTLQSARAQAMQLGKVVRVYFLDGGKWDRDYGFDSNGGTYAAERANSGVDGYLRSYGAYDVPYELMTVTKDGQELSRTQLPSGVAWISLGNYKTIPAVGAVNPYLVQNAADVTDYANVKSLQRACSLAINFGPSGSAWSDAAPVRADATPDPNRPYEDSLSCLRIFMLDDLDSAHFVYTTRDSYFAYTTVMTKEVTVATIKYILNNQIERTGEAAGTNTIKDRYPKGGLKWLTVKMNYTTGLCSLVDGESGE